MNTAETYKYKGWTVTIDYDQFGSDPSEWGNYTIAMAPSTRAVSVGAKWDDYVDDDGMPTEDTIAKVQAGKVWPISYSSHGPQCAYHIALDSSDADGYIEFTPEYTKGVMKRERKQYAKSDLETYTEWANGQVYYVSFVTPYGKVPDDGDVAGMGDIIGYDNAVQFANQAVDDAINWDRPNYHAIKAQDLHR